MHFLEINRFSRLYCEWKKKGANPQKVTCYIIPAAYHASNDIIIEMENSGSQRVGVGRTKKGRGCGFIKSGKKGPCTGTLLGLDCG